MVWWVEHKHCIFHIAKTVYEHIRQLVKDNTAWKKLHGEFWQWPSCYQRLKSDAPSTIVTKVLPKLTPFAGQLLCAKAAQLMQYHVEEVDDRDEDNVSDIVHYVVTWSDDGDGTNSEAEEQQDPDGLPAVGCDVDDHRFRGGCRSSLVRWLSGVEETSDDGCGVVRTRKQKN